ncbi:MAG: hypothetical protein ACK4RK_04130 [Gemmataceae bacterium]
MIIGIGTVWFFTPIWGFGVPDVGPLILKILAALGGGVVGAVVTIVLVQMLCRWKLPRIPRNIAGAVGGVVLGALIWIWMSESGSLGLGGGAGFWPFPQDQAGDSKGAQQPPNAITETAPPVRRVRIELLGGQRYPGAERYYLLEGNPQPLTLEEIARAIQELWHEEPPVRQVRFVFDAKESISEIDPAFTRLEDRLIALGLEIVRPHEIKTTSPQGS